MFFFAHCIPFFCCKNGSIFITNGINRFVARFSKIIHQTTDFQRLVSIFIVIMIKQLHKNPLRPFIIFRVRSTHFSRPIIAKTDLFQLANIGIDIFFSSNGRMLPRLNSILFGRQTKRVETHWVQDIKALQTLVASNYIRGNIPKWMPNVQARSRWIWEHIQDVIFWFIVVNFSFESFFFLPKLSPFLFYFFKIVFHFLLGIRCWRLGFKGVRQFLPFTFSPFTIHHFPQN